MSSARTKLLGLKIGEALFSDGLVAGFRAVHVLGDEARAEHEGAVVNWLAAARGGCGLVSPPTPRTQHGRAPALMSELREQGWYWIARSGQPEIGFWDEGEWVTLGSETEKYR